MIHGRASLAFATVVTLASACSLGGTKDACLVDGDCNPGRVCVAGLCASPDASAGDASATDGSDAGPKDAAPDRPANDGGATDATDASCAAGARRCGDACTATSTDLANCGACGNACPSPINGAATCVDGACGIACDAGWVATNQACTASPCMQEADGTYCNYPMPSACYHGSCVALLATCEDETYGSDWVPNVLVTRWNWGIDGNKPCTCDGAVLTDQAHSMRCNRCQFIATLEMMGGAQTEAGITDQVWGCF